MLRDFPILCFQAAVWAGLTFTALPVLAQAGAAPLILILNSYDKDTAPYFRVRDIFVEELERNYEMPLVFRQYHLDERRHDRPKSDDLKARLLELSYRESPPALVVAIGPPAISFWLAHRDTVAAEAPLMAAAGEFTLDADKLRPDDMAVVTRFSFADAVEDILDARPDTTELVMVFGASNHERSLESLARAQLQDYSERLDIEYTNDLTLAALQRKLGALPASSVVFYGVFSIDANGLSLDTYSGLTLVRAASKVPVFGAFDDLLGRGILGGRLIQLDEVGREMALTAEELLRKSGEQDRWKVVDLSKPTFAWPELKAWRIDAARLPPDHVVKFKPPTLWESYFEWILLAVFVFVAQTLLLFALFLQRRQRRRAELANLSLSHRLMTAFEDERRLVARELHDDVSQRLARAAIDASIIKSSPDSAAARAALEELQPELVRISKDVHDMSYRLHPSLVDDLGISAALQAECERLRRRTSVTIRENIRELRKQVSGDTALCLYRIAQEALTNAIKYAEAEIIEISLQTDNGALRLEVHDDGLGFKVERVHAGLGLTSMRERAQLAGGWFSIRSQPGKGTLVTAVVPRNGPAL